MRTLNVAMAGALLLFVGCRFENRLPIDMVSVNRTQPVGQETGLDASVRFDIGSLEITGQRGDTLYSVDLDYDKASNRLEIRYDPPNSRGAGRLSLDLHSSHPRGIRRERYNNKLRLAFDDSVPLRLRVNAGVGDARLSLSDIRLSQLELESGVGTSKISAYNLNPVVCESIRFKNGVGSMEAVGLGNLNFRRFEFEGGVGGASLDFTGEWKQDADIRIQVGIGGVNVRIPREIGVRVEAEKNLLSGLHLEGFSQRGSHYYSGNYDSASVRISVRVETGIGGLRITWV